MRDQANLTQIRPGFVMTPQPTCPIPLGSSGIWYDSVAATLKFRLPSGADSVIVGPAGLPNAQTFTSDGVGGPILPAAAASGGTLANVAWAYYTGPGGVDPKIPIYSDGVAWRDSTGAAITP
jgi:hypothetical protein